MWGKSLSGKCKLSMFVGIARGSAPERKEMFGEEQCLFTGGKDEG